MPFVKKNEPKGVQPVESQTIFVGRANELNFFQDSILAPADPAYNIVSIYGNGGVGKSTLVNRLFEEIQAAEFKDYCLAAIVDERQATPANMMEKFADQLHMADFKRALSHYKDMLRKSLEEQDSMQDALLQRAPDFAGAAVEGVPIVGPLLREGLKLTTSRVLHEYSAGQSRKDSERLDDSVADLTRSFITGLNQLADAFVPVEAGWAKRRRRVLLFFDTFEQLAAEAAPWLLDYFLEAEISSNIVLVTSGRYPIERSIPDDPKRWMPYRDHNIIYSISLNSFSEAETRRYLEQRGVTDPTQIDSIWRLSRGLPLYLSLLTWSPERVIDPTADVVANFLRWIPEREEVKRRLVLDASLFSRPFNQDDLAAFAYCAEKERPALFHWLSSQPFVRKNAADGRYSYHELAEDLFSRHLYQLSPQACYTTRRALADYYRQGLTLLHDSLGSAGYGSAEWLSLTLALARQLFLLPDATNHNAALACCLEAYERTKQDEEISRILRDLVEEQPYNLANRDTRQAARVLLAYLDAEPFSLPMLEALNNLLARVANVAVFSRTLLAYLYSNRGITHRALKHYQQALGDFDRAIALQPDNGRSYGRRGNVYLQQNNIEQAKADFARSCALDPSNIRTRWMYAWVMLCQPAQLEESLSLLASIAAQQPEHYIAYLCRAVQFWLQGQIAAALQELEAAVVIRPSMWDAHFWRGYILQRTNQQSGEQEIARALQMGMPAALQNIAATPTQ